MKFKLEISLGTDAMQTRNDLEWALRNLGQLKYMSEIPKDGDEGTIHDLNGNRVGSWGVVADASEAEPILRLKEDYDGTELGEDFVPAGTLAKIVETYPTGGALIKFANANETEWNDISPEEVKSLFTVVKDASTVSDTDKQILIVWDADDVHAVRPDLTNEQCMEVLRAAKRGHDASIGINWDVLETHADMMFPKTEAKWKCADCDFATDDHDIIIDHRVTVHGFFNKDSVLLVKGTA